MSSFRLASLFRVRRIQEDHAAAELAVAVEERVQADDLTERARRRLEESQLPESADVLRWQAAVATRAAASASVRDATVAGEVARHEELLAQQMWTAARTRTTMLEKLAVRHQAAEEADLVRQEQHLLDEIASQRSLRRESQ